MNSRIKSIVEVFLTVEVAKVNICIFWVATLTLPAGDGLMVQLWMEVPMFWFRPVHPCAMIGMYCPLIGRWGYMQVQTHSQFVPPNILKFSLKYINL